MKIATLWLLLKLFISEEVIWGTGCGRFRWNENGRSPIVLVLGPGIPTGGGGTLIYYAWLLISVKFWSLTLSYEIFLFKFFWELTCYRGSLYLIDYLEVSCSLLVSLKNGDPLLRSWVAPPAVRPPAWLGYEPNNFWLFCSVFVTDWPGVFSFLYLLFFKRMSLKFFSF